MSRRRPPPTVRRRPPPRSPRRSVSRRGDEAARPVLHAGLYLAAGLALGVGAFWAFRRVERIVSRPPSPPPAVVPRPAPVPPRVRRAARFYNFYELLKGVGHERLPRPEVINPARDHDVVLDRDRRPVRRPGRYILQVASFRRLARARAVVARLALLGLAARIDSARLPDGEVWHRVRIGPLADLGRLNRVRRILAAHRYRPLLMIRGGAPSS